MRKFLVAAAVVVAALVTAAIALGTTQRTYSQNFSTGPGEANTTKTNAISGTYFKEQSVDPANTQNNQQPQLDKEVDVAFPKGAKIDTSVPASCKAEDNAFSEQNAPCPKKSIVGVGHAVTRTRYSNAPDIPATVTAFNCKSKCFKPSGSTVKNKNQLVLYVNPTPGNPIILRANITGSPGKGQVIKTPIPINCVLGTPPNCGSSGDIRIIEFDLTINKVTRKKKVHGKKRRVGYLTTPPSCPKDKTWPFAITFKPGDASGSEQTAHDTSPCKAPRKKK